MMKLRINLSKFTFADIFTAALFILLIVTAAMFGRHFKDNIKWVLLFVGVMAATSFFARPPYKTSIPFYLLLLILFYITYFYWVTLLADLIPKSEQPHHVSTGWFWGLLSALFLAPLSVKWYHVSKKRKTVLEAALAASFIIVMAIHLLF